MYRLYLVFMLYCIFNIQKTYSQSQENQDTISTKNNANILKKVIKYFEDSNQVDNNKRFDVSFVGGPHYSSDTKLGLGLVASGLYRIDNDDLSISPSNISLFSDITTSGSFVIGVDGNTIFPKEKYRLDFTLYFLSLPSRYWGIGYEKGNNKDDYTKYTKKEVQVKTDFLRKIAPNVYIGAVGAAQYIKGTSFKDISYLEGRDVSNVAIGGGAILTYDSRDFIPNPYKGSYLKLEYNIYPSLLGSSHTFNRTNLTLRHYRPIWKNAILAFDFEGIFNNGNTPWSMLASIGDSHRMRGYFGGQYRDKKLIQAQVEIRQRIHGRSGVVVWAGAGNAFPSFDSFEWGHTLPTFGTGYRWEFKNRINIRLDYGIGKKQSAFYFNINEAF